MGRGKPGRPRKWTRGTEIDVRRLRREGLCQEATARRLGISQALVSEIERDGKKKNRRRKR
jgi:transcriptional regulator